jgi:hypothetical protein
MAATMANSKGYQMESMPFMKTYGNKLYDSNEKSHGHQASIGQIPSDLILSAS